MMPITGVIFKKLIPSPGRRSRQASAARRRARIGRAMSWTFCHRCGSLIPKGAERCGRCRAIQAPPAWTTRRWLQLVLLVGLAMASVVVGLLARIRDPLTAPPAALRSGPERSCNDFRHGETTIAVRG
jgi:hypothetical protein